MNDADLVLNVRQGSADAYTTLMGRYRQAIYALAYHHLQDFDS